LLTWCAKVWPVEYAAYIKSDIWRRRAFACKARAGWRCEVCNSPYRLQAHHRDYRRVGWEAPGDLTCLCDGCHALFSKAGRLVRL
jgi:hypothetical protein